MQQGFQAAANSLHRSRADTDRRFSQVYGDMREPRKIVLRARKPARMSQKWVAYA
jgi:hypothetical protein